MHSPPSECFSGPPVSLCGTWLSCRLACREGAHRERGATLRMPTSVAEPQDVNMRLPMSAWEMGERHPTKVCLPCLCTPQQAWA